MSIIVYIPFRKGSTRLPGKNTQKLCGRPLFRWTVDYARVLRPTADRIVISTDDEEAQYLARRIPDKRIEVYDRLPENATSEATTSSSVKEYLERAENPVADEDIIILMHVTTIGRVRRDISELFGFLDRPGVNLVGYMQHLKRYLFQSDGQGFVTVSNRGDSRYYRTQELDERECPYVSFGEILTCYARAWRRSELELSLEPGFFVLPSESLLVDIDTGEDFEHAEVVMSGLLAQERIFYNLND